MINILLSRSIVNDPSVYLYLKNYINPKMRILVIPWAFGKNETMENYTKESDYISELYKKFIPYQIDYDNFNVLSLDDPYDVALDKIKKQDIIYLPGGFPDLFYERIREKGISEAIKQNAKIIIGSSAGALIQFKQYHLTPDNDYKEISFHYGLGLLDNFRVEVHYENNKKKNKNLEQVLDMAPIDCYTLEDSQMIIIDEGKIITLFGAKKYIPKLKKTK